MLGSSDDEAYDIRGSNGQKWIPEKVAEVHRMRRHGFTPAEIAQAVGRTKASIDILLSLEKKRGIVHEPLRHGLLKWDKAIVEEWRKLAKELTYREIAKKYGISHVLISQKFAMDLHGELRF